MKGIMKVRTVEGNSEEMGYLRGMRNGANFGFGENACGYQRCSAVGKELCDAIGKECAIWDGV